MTLEELEGTLPNGLHDAEIRTILVDYSRRCVTMELTAWIGDMDRVEAPREAWRDARLTLEGMQFVVMEAPDPTYKFAEKDHLWVDVTHDRKHLHVPAISQLPNDCFVSGFFVQEWNSFLIVAARSARLDWTGEMVNWDPEH